jgi:hypothetical protein
VTLDPEHDALAAAARALRDQLGAVPPVHDLHALRAWRAAASLAAGRYELAAATLERAARRGA